MSLALDAIRGRGACWTVFAVPVSFVHMKVCVICKARFRGDLVTCPLDGGAVVDALVGRELAGRYVLSSRDFKHTNYLECAAVHAELGVKVSVLLPRWLPTGQGMEEMVRRTTVAAGVSVRAVSDFGEDEDIGPFIVTDWVRGLPLQAHLEKNGAMSSALARRVFGDVADALVCAHRVGVMHLALRPEHIMVIPEGRGTKAVVYAALWGFGDRIGPRRFFGGKRLMLPVDRTYVPPEVFAGVEPDARTDVFTLGLSLYQALTDESPAVAMGFFEFLPPDRHRRAIAPFERVLHRALVYKRAERYASMSELADAIREVKTDY